MSPIHTIARVVLIDEGHLCVCTNPKNPSYVYLPGGHVEEGETSDESIHREIAEEMGETLTSLTFLGVVENVFHRPHSCHSHEINLIFKGQLATYRYPTTPVSLEPACVEFKWIPLTALAHHHLLPTLLATLIPDTVGEAPSTLFYRAVNDRRSYASS